MKLDDLVNFNSHAHVERDTILVIGTRLIFHFNSHAHVERDPVNLWVGAVNLNFNSHAHVERDLVVRDLSPHFLSIFQLTRSRGA